MSTTAPAPRWGSPVDPDRNIAPAGLQAGDEVGPAPAPVDAHLVVPVAVPRRVAPPRSLDDVRDTARATLRHSPMLAAWALLGVGVALRRIAAWWWDQDGHPMLGTIVAESDKAYTIMAQKRAERQRYRAMVIGGGILTALAGTGALYATARWALLPLTVAALGWLAWLGKPADARMIVTPTVTTTGAPRLTSALIVNALCSLGISPLTRALERDSGRLWRSPIAEVPGGYRVHLQLPDAVTADKLVPYELELASALGRPADCVIVEPLRKITPGDLYLWILNEPIGGDIGPGPLAKSKRTSWFEAVSIGKTRTGAEHREPLRGGAWFIGGRPNAGKSSLCRLAAAQTALDPRARLIVVNLKGSPDYLPLKPLCHRYISAAPETNRTVIAEVTDLVQWILDEGARRNDYLTELVDIGKADSNDVTPELARRYDRLVPITVVLDEVHRLVDKHDNPEWERASTLLTNAIKAVRSAGITFVCATQLAGIESIPPALTRAARLRGCLHVSEENSFRQIFGQMGQGVFNRLGIAFFRPGTVLLRSDEGQAVKVAVWNLGRQHMRDIAARALELRRSAGSLTGEAAGEPIEAGGTDPDQLLRDLLDIIPTTAPASGSLEDQRVAWIVELEEVLAGRAAYSDRSPGWLATELRSRGVAMRQANRKIRTDSGELQQRNLMAVRTVHVRQALLGVEATGSGGEGVSAEAESGGLGG